MASARRLLELPAIQAIACGCAALYIRLVWMTGRWVIEGTDIRDRFVRDGKPFIACFWHGRLMMVPYAWRRDTPMSVLISRHRDGRLIARLIGHFGVGTIAGSTSRGGGAALRSMLSALATGQYVGITPDGPRGPRMRATAGVVRAARLAGVAIVPVSFAASRRRVLGSWDRFVIALPFSRGVIRIGAPIPPPRDDSDAAIEASRRRLEDTLNGMTRDLDILLGVAPIEAAELPGSLAGDKSRLEAAECGR